MTEIKIKRCADKENLKELMRYIKATFATQGEINENFYTIEQINTMLESISGGGGGGTGGVPATNEELDELTTEWSFE